MNDETVVRRAATLARLRRIEGQVRGLHRMVEAERECAEVLTQLSSVQEALRAVGRELLRTHLKHCTSRTRQGGDGPVDAICDELLDLLFKHIR